MERSPTTFAPAASAHVSSRRPSTTPRESGWMPEIWSVYANEEACDLAMRAPGAGLGANDEVMVRGPIAEALRAAIRTVDSHALIREATEGWAEVVIEGGDARDVF